LLKERIAEEEKAKREAEDERKRAEAEMRRQHPKATRNLIMPTYKLNERLNVDVEVDVPPETLFLPLGWNPTSADKKRHYRRWYNTELETIKEIMPVPTPFDQYVIKKGQTRGASKGFFSFGGSKEDESGETTTEQVMGLFKGIIVVETEEEQARFKDEKKDRVHQLKNKLNRLSLKKLQEEMRYSEKKLETLEGRAEFNMKMEKLGIGHLNIAKCLADLDHDEHMKRLLMGKTKCTVRLYVVDALDLSSRDNGGESDPYLYITLGNKVYNDRENYQEDEPNPDFYQKFDFEADFPGCPPLVLSIYDQDTIFGDDLIGSTTIDLEDRFFLPEWNTVKRKPIEQRKLFYPSSSIAQGHVRCWVEIWPTITEPEQIEEWDIAPKPKEIFEVRLVVHDTTDVIAMDVEGTSDVFCRAFFDKKLDKETDTHFRCQDGKASFNYRLLYDFEYPNKNYTLFIQLYDRDLLKANDLIG